MAPPIPGPVVPLSPQVPSSTGSTRILAGLLAIFLGPLGIHKFVLGMPGPGITVLLITVLTCFYGSIVTGIFGIIEGIIYLTRSDAEFHQVYVLQKRAWF